LYKLTKIDGLREKPKSYFSFGNSLHKALAYFYSYIPPPSPLNDFLAYYKENWIGEGYENEEEERNHFEYGKKILKEFHALHTKDFRSPLAVEHRFQVDLDGVPVRGVIDRVDKLQNGKVELVDYKTSRDLFDLEDVLENDQLTLYQIGIEKSMGMQVEKLTLYHLRSQTPVSSKRRSEARVAEVVEMIHKVADSIEEERFDPKLGSYCPCDFPEYCPYFKQQFLEKEERREAEDLVEDYVSLREQEKSLGERIESLRQEIERYCEERKILRVFGKEHLVTLSYIEKTGFDEKELKKLLQPHDLWKKVLSYDEKLAKRLIKDPSLPKPLKENMKKLERVIQSYYQLRYRRMREEELEEGFDPS